MNKHPYQQKRDFSKTDEPIGGTANGTKGNPIFVIQKHDASNLHYDIRLQVGGVLKSWAVPKGPSTDPKEKRLAIATEDHPIDYADYEGVIPQGEYGEGAVLIWDKGTYEHTSSSDDTALSPVEALERGEITFKLHGSKLQGEYALVRMNKAKDQWLLVKKHDSHADARRNPTSTEPKSVTSGRKIDDIKKEEND